MFTERIRRHNTVNGFLFSSSEFALVALLTGSFSIYTLSVGKIFIGAVELGIALNCLPVIFYGVRSIVRKEKCIGVAGWFHAATRTEIANKYPETSMDTAALVAATVIPFAGLGLAIFDLAKLSK